MKVHKMCLAGVLAGSSAAWGHGLQIQITYNPTSNRIETRRVVATSSSLTAFGYQTPLQAGISPITRVYVMPLLQTTTFPGANPSGAGPGVYTRPAPQLTSAGVPQFPSGPGVAWQYDTRATVPGTFTGIPTPIAGTGWALNGTSTGDPLVNLTGTRFGMRFNDSFKQWDGTAFVDPGTEQFQGFAGDATQPFTGSTPNAITTDAGGGPGFQAANPIGTLWSNNPHNSWSFRLLGDGVSPSAPSDAGIYLAQMVITSTALVPGTSTPIGDSDPLFFVMYHSDSPSALDEAIAVAQTLGFPLSQIQVAVPEPGVVGVSILAGAILLRRRPR